MKLKREGYEIDITLVFTSYASVKRELSYDGAEDYYKDIETMIFEIENEHYKKQIIVSNQKMVDISDEIVVYFTGKRQFNNNNGTERIVKYATKNNKLIINLCNI